LREETRLAWEPGKAEEIKQLIVEKPALALEEKTKEFPT
jgi:hypothetical protein